MVDNCKWNVKESPKQTSKQGKWHEPVNNPQITIWTQSGCNDPSNAVFGARNNRHQGVDLFALEGTNVYACLGGIVDRIVTRDAKGNYVKGQGITVVIKIHEAEIPIFRSRRMQYSPKYPEVECSQGPEFDLNSKSIYLVYYHLSEIDAKVKIKEPVEAGQIIGKSGITGVPGGTCGPHLHFEIRNKSIVSKSSSKLVNRCNPAFYVDYKQADKLSDNEKSIQEQRKKRGRY